MTPIRSNDAKKHTNPAIRRRPLLDLRTYNMVHAAPMENDQAFLFMRFDPATGSLFPYRS